MFTNESTIDCRSPGHSLLVEGFEMWIECQLLDLKTFGDSHQDRYFGDGLPRKQRRNPEISPAILAKMAGDCFFF